MEEVRKVEVRKEEVGSEEGRNMEGGRWKEEVRKVEGGVMREATYKKGVYICGEGSFLACDLRFPNSLFQIHPSSPDRVNGNHQ